MIWGMEDFLQHPAIDALGWTLIHSLWQGLLLWGALQVMLKWIPETASQRRYTAALTLLALLPVFSIVTFIVLISDPLQSSPVLRMFGSQLSDYHLLHVFLTNNMPWLLTAWGIGTLIFGARLAIGWKRLSGLEREAYSVHGEWQERLHTLAVSIGLSRPVALAETLRLNVPVVIGFMKPLILVPVGMLSSLSPAQVETVLLHELAHIKRNDFLVNALQSLVEVFYYFNPLAWWMSEAVRREREFCCDDEVVTLRSPRVYAAALANLEEAKLQKQEIAMALADERFGLLRRIKRMTGQQRRSSLFEKSVTIASFSVLSLIMLYALSPALRNEPADTQAALPVEVGSRETSTVLRSDDPKRNLRAPQHDDVYFPEGSRTLTSHKSLTEQSQQANVDDHHIAPARYQSSFMRVVSVTAGGSTATFTSWVIEEQSSYNESTFEIRVNVLLIQGSDQTANPSIVKVI